MEWDWGKQSCRNWIKKPERLGQKAWMDTRISIRCCITRSYRLYLKLFEQSSLAGHHNNFLMDYFNIDKTKKLIGKKYYWSSFKKDFEAYIKGCNVYLAL